MKWGHFSKEHFISLAVAGLIIVLLYLFLKNKSKLTQTLILFLFSLTGIAAIIFNLIYWKSPLEYLPLHLCSLNAILLPIAVISKNKTINNLLLLWSMGALFGLVMNQSASETKIFDLQFCFYYFPHIFEFGIPLLMFMLGLAKRDKFCIKTTLFITIMLYTLVHITNLKINDYCILNEIKNQSGHIINVNYMFSLKPENQVFEYFYKLIPHTYWYMYLCLPIIIIYLALIYIDQIFKKKETKSTSENTTRFQY